MTATVARLWSHGSETPPPRAVTRLEQSSAQYEEVPDVLRGTEDVVEPWAADLTAGDPSTAALLVERTPTRPGGFSVVGLHAGDPLGYKDDKSFARPEFVLKDLGDDQGLHAAEIYDEMAGWSESKEPITSWLLRLIETGTIRSLVIGDNTPYEVPWELLVLDESVESWDALLGARVAVSRWCAPGGHLPPPPEPRRGQALTLIHRALAWAEEEKAVFGEPDHHQLDTMRKALCDEKAKENVALVYLACHGIVDDTASGWILTGGDEQLRHGELFRAHMKLLERWRALVFLNACGSGRVRYHSLLRDARVRGFVTGFMNYGARGVIGTLGNVDSETAVEVAKTLVRAWKGNDNAAVPELLRRLRQAKVNEVPDLPDDSDLVPLVTVFLYAYYGEPGLMVQLQNAEGGG